MKTSGRMDEIRREFGVMAVGTNASGWGWSLSFWKLEEGNVEFLSCNASMVLRNVAVDRHRAVGCVVGECGSGGNIA